MSPEAPGEGHDVSGEEVAHLELHDQSTDRRIRRKQGQWNEGMDHVLGKDYTWNGVNESVMLDQ